MCGVEVSCKRWRKIHGYLQHGTWLKRSAAVTHLNGVNVINGAKVAVLGCLRRTEQSFNAEDLWALVIRWDESVDVARGCVANNCSFHSSKFVLFFL